MKIDKERAHKYFKKLILDEITDYGYCWIAWGCIIDYMKNWKITSDVDIYCASKEDRDSILEYLLDNEWHIIRERWSDITPTVPSMDKITYNWITIDLIRTIYDNPNDCINNFDFTVVWIAMDTQSVYTLPGWAKDFLQSNLSINKLPNPKWTKERVSKYINKWYQITKEEYEKIENAWNTRAPTKEDRENSVKVIGWIFVIVLAILCIANR